MTESALDICPKCGAPGFRPHPEWRAPPALDVERLTLATRAAMYPVPVTRSIVERIAVEYARLQEPERSEKGTGGAE